MIPAPNRKYIVNSDAFLQENDISFYLLGAYMTDGNISDRKYNISCSISSKDKIWIENIQQIICPTKPIYSSKQSICYTSIVFDVNSVNWLSSYGCKPRKSKTLIIEKNIPEKYHQDFIRGLIDGDGSISSCKYKKIKNNKEYWYTKKTIYLCSASKIFIDQIASIIPNSINKSIVTILPKQSIIRGKLVMPTCNIYRLQFNDKNAKLLAEWIYYTNHRISMPRKKELALTLS
jgi:hypothetical protein